MLDAIIGQRRKQFHVETRQKDPGSLRRVQAQLRLPWVDQVERLDLVRRTSLDIVGREEVRC